MGSEGTRKLPALSDSVFHSTPVAWFFVTTLACGTAPPVASVTVPFRTAVDCASALLPKTTESMTMRKARENKLRGPIKFLSITSIFLLLLIENQLDGLIHAPNGFAIAVPELPHRERLRKRAVSMAYRFT